MVLLILACFFQSLIHQPAKVPEQPNTVFADRIKPRLVRLVQSIEELYNTPAGTTTYRPGECVTQKEHALQTADLAKIGLPHNDSIVVSALLHDIGQLISHSFNLNTDEIGYDFIRKLWGEEIAIPILHSTTAKRFLAAVDAGYVSKLSQAKQLTLIEQGGAFAQDNPDYCAFRKHPDFFEIISLRRWDDQATVCGKPTSTFLDYRELLVEKAYEHLRKNYTDHEIEEVIALIQESSDLIRGGYN